MRRPCASGAGVGRVLRGSGGRPVDPSAPSEVLVVRPAVPSWTDQLSRRKINVMTGFSLRALSPVIISHIVGRTFLQSF